MHMRILIVFFLLTSISCFSIAYAADQQKTPTEETYRNYLWEWLKRDCLWEKWLECGGLWGKDRSGNANERRAYAFAANLCKRIADLQSQADEIGDRLKPQGKPMSVQEKLEQGKYLGGSMEHVEMGIYEAQLDAQYKCWEILVIAAREIARKRSPRMPLEPQQDIFPPNEVQIIDMDSDGLVDEDVVMHGLVPVPKRPEDIRAMRKRLDCEFKVETEDLRNRLQEPEFRWEAKHSPELQWELECHGIPIPK